MSNKYDFRFYVVRSQRMAGYLMHNGFRLRGFQPDNDCEGRNVFFFVNTDKLLEAIEAYKGQNNHKLIKL